MWQGDDEYDEYSEGLACEVWTCRNGQTVKVSKMTERHLRGARKVAMRAKQRSTFTYDEEKWQNWIDLFDHYLNIKIVSSIENKKKLAPKKSTTNPTPPRGNMIEMLCHCGNNYTAREADLKRGWALSCSKRCAAIRRDYGRPASVVVATGKPYKKGK